MSFVDSYDELLGRGIIGERSEIREVLRLLDDFKDVIFIAPTGYGKTTLTYCLAHYVGSWAKRDGNPAGESPKAYSVIHVLPLRSIVQDIRERFREWARKLGIKEDYVGAYDTDFHEAPFFLKRVNITTVDSFVYSLLKVPPVEMRGLMVHGKAHYELARSMILNSVVVFDELHLMLQDKETATATLASMRLLEDFQVPFVAMSATLPPNLEHALGKNFGLKVEVVRASGSTVERTVKWTYRQTGVGPAPTGQVRSRDLSDAIARIVPEILNEEDRSVLVVLNTRRGAIDCYRRLVGAGERPVLIHGKMVPSQRRDAVSKILNKDGSRPRVIVATQVVEAGMDFSSDVLITELAPLESLIQRAGRVARYGGEGEVVVLPISEESSSIYGEGEVRQAEEMLKRANGTLDMDDIPFRDLSVDHRRLLNYEKIATDMGVDSNKVREFMETLCSFTRGSQLVPGLVTITKEGKRTVEAVGLTEGEAKRLFSLGARWVLSEGEDSGELRPPYPNECLQVWMMRNGVEGLDVTQFWDETVGLDWEGEGGLRESGTGQEERGEPVDRGLGTRGRG